MIGSYAVALFLTGYLRQRDDQALYAALITGVYVLVMQAIPRRVRLGGVAGEVLATAGVVVTLVAVGLTNGANHGYLMMVLVPIFFAASFLGTRVGLEVAVLASLGLVVTYLAIGDLAALVTNLVFVALYLLFGVTFSQARRLLILEQERSEELRASTEMHAGRLARLHEAHNLLVDLASLAATSELSAVTVSRSTLLELAATVPIEAGQINLATQEGALATWGLVPAGAAPEEYPIESEEGNLGTLSLWPLPDSDLAEHDVAVEAAVTGLALAFDNITLLLRVARRAVQDERTRVARQLHDEIGPGLASLGLVVDIMIGSSTEPATTAQLERVRRDITGLVERVRGSVALLRRSDARTLTDYVHAVVTEMGDGPPRVASSLVEQEAPDGFVAAEVGAIVTEAVRNAAHHANATLVRIEGQVDGGAGTVRVVDNGTGFDPGADYPGHFGLVGMRERAAAVGATFDIASRPGRGTTLTVQWGGPPTGET